MSEHCHDGHEHGSQHRACANLFGCGDEQGTGIIREDIKDAVFQKRTADTLLHMERGQSGKTRRYLSARGRGRRKFLQASSFMGVLAAVEPWFARLARAQDKGARPTPQPDRGRVHQMTGPRPRRLTGWAIGKTNTSSRRSLNMVSKSTRLR